MNALPAPQFDTFEEISSLRRLPVDWPEPGPIELSVHDLPHASASLEWWSVNCHVETVDGRDLSLFAAFGRERFPMAPGRRDLAIAHSVVWAICDPHQSLYSAKVSVDGLAPALALAKLDATTDTTGSRLDRALREVLMRGQVPAPTQLLSAPVRVDQSSLGLDYGGDSLFKRGAREYFLSLYDDRTKVGCDLFFVPQKRPVRYGANGIARGARDEVMFHYFIPRCSVSGHVTIDRKTRAVGSGTGWLDHEFGFSHEAKAASKSAKTADPQQTASSRSLSLQLDNGYELSVSVTSRPNTGEVLDDWLLLIDPEGNRRAFGGVNLRETKTWRSTRSFVSYPVAFAVDMPEARLSLEVSAVFADQEVLTTISTPGFWRGRVSATGVLNGREFTAKGWAECTGSRYSDVDGLLAAVASEVRERLAAVLPSEPHAAELERRPGSAESGLARPQRANILAASERAGGSNQPPLGSTLRADEAWRSYAALACIDVVGGDSRKFSHWMLLPELLHAGSLIVNDVEHGESAAIESPGGHAPFGRALAINAATTAYFLAEPPLFRAGVSLQSILRIYGLYFDALRAGHTGQALELVGYDAAAAHCLRSGDTTVLESRVLNVHRLKTAVPAAAIARIGAILGGGTDPQIEGVGAFFEALGLAYRIVDDVLDVRRFSGVEERGGKGHRGQMTLPIVKTLERLPSAERDWLYCALRSQSGDPQLSARVFATVEAVGSLEACLAQAQDLVARAWAELDPLLEESQAKLMLFAFSEYVFERHH